MIFILNFVFTIMFYVMRWIKLYLNCICLKNFLNQLNLLYINICLYLHHDKNYESRELMSHNMDYNYSLNW
jgi:hypothetical protein